MSQTGDQLVVRQHERFVCALPVDVTVTPDSPSRVTLSAKVGQGTGVVSASVVDCSVGGVGIESELYLPRLSRLRLRIAGNGGPIELEGTVQRVNMISRAPRYYLGVSFRGGRAPDPAAVQRLLHLAAGGTGAPA